MEGGGGGKAHAREGETQPNVFARVATIILGPWALSLGAMAPVLRTLRSLRKKFQNGVTRAFPKHNHVPGRLTQADAVTLFPPRRSLTLWLRQIGCRQGSKSPVLPIPPEVLFSRFLRLLGQTRTHTRTESTAILLPRPNRQGRRRGGVAYRISESRP